MKRIKRILLLTCVFIGCMLLTNQVQAKSYTIENMDIQASIKQNGNVAIKQEITYDFNGSYNGIYINVPYHFEDKEYEEAISNAMLDESSYNGDSIIMNKVSELKDGKEIVYKEVIYAKNGHSAVYTTQNNKGLQETKVYAPAIDTSKTFRLEYEIENLCLKHNDIGELYYNFIGGAWEVPIKNLNIDILLPENQEEIQIWGHGPYDGSSKIVSNKVANFKVDNVKPGQYVATRIIFPTQNIAQSKKVTNIDAKEQILREESAIFDNQQEKANYTYKIIFFAVVLFIYWIILMWIFEKDKKLTVSNLDEDALFEKYNPMIAGCIQGSRTILARDIIAVILNLVDKKIIKLESYPLAKGKDKYQYNITKVTEKEQEMDGIERYIYDWVFNTKDTVDLNSRLDSMPRDKDANKKFKALNDMVEETLAKKGANQAKVPMYIRGLNVLLFILSVFFVAKHVLFNGFEIYSSQTASIFITQLFKYTIVVFPLIIGLLYIPINLIVILRHKVNKTVQKITGQKVVTTTITLVIFFGIIILFTAIFTPYNYLIADEILICIATIILITDNMMLKNDAIMIEDYSKLNTLKSKIEEYSLMEDRDIEQIILWEKYLSYAVSFGLAKKIIKRIKGLELEDDLLRLVNSGSMYQYIYSDYYLFYTHASLDRRFMKTYNSAMGKMITGSGGSGRGRRFFWRRWILRRRR